MVLSRLLALVKVLTLSVEIDFATPVWLLPLQPDTPTSASLELSAKRVLLKASLMPSEGGKAAPPGSPVARRLSPPVSP